MNSKQIVPALVVIALIIVVAGVIYASKQKNAVSVTPATQQSMQNTMMPASPSASMMAMESSGSGEASSSATGTVKEFTVTGGNFYFSPNTLTVNKGDSVKITFKNAGGSHDFVLDAFTVKTPIIPSNQSTTVQFVADKAGTFQYYCSVGNHRAMGMAGTLTVK